MSFAFLNLDCFDAPVMLGLSCDGDQVWLAAHFHLQLNQSEWIDPFFFQHLQQLLTFVSVNLAFPFSRRVDEWKVGSAVKNVYRYMDYWGNFSYVSKVT